MSDVHARRRYGISVPIAVATIIAVSTGGCSRVSTIDQLCVFKTDLDFDAPQEQDGQLMLEFFANRPDAWKSMTPAQENWYEKSQAYRRRLVDLANEQGLESQSLDKVLAHLQVDSDSPIAMVPVAAYYARKGRQGVWIVAQKWELVGFGDALEHYRISALSIPDLVLVDFRSCD